MMIMVMIDDDYHDTAIIMLRIIVIIIMFMIRIKNNVSWIATSLLKPVVKITNNTVNILTIVTATIMLVKL